MKRASAPGAALRVTHGAIELPTDCDGAEHLQARLLRALGLHGTFGVRGAGGAGGGASRLVLRHMAIEAGAEASECSSCFKWMPATETARCSEGHGVCGDCMGRIIRVEARAPRNPESSGLAQCTSRLDSEDHISLLANHKSWLSPPPVQLEGHGRKRNAGLPFAAVCNLFNAGCQAAPFPDAVLSRLLPPEAFAEFARLTRQEAERKAVAEVEKSFECVPVA